jgi:hypothetical protein
MGHHQIQLDPVLITSDTPSGGVKDKKKPFGCDQQTLIIISHRNNQKRRNHQLGPNGITHMWMVPLGPN